jgi:hypothetical protein
VQAGVVAEVVSSGSHTYIHSAKRKKGILKILRGVVVFSFNPSTQEGEAGGSQVGSQLDTQ